MARIYVGIGSNCEREKNIRAALVALKHHFGELNISTVYESMAVGFNGAPFYNLVVGFDTALSVKELSNLFKKIEDDNGRVRKHHHDFSDRTLDIDLLLYDAAVGVIDGIELPRKEITENAFVLWPLSEIAGELRHPVIQKKIAQLWNDYNKNKQELKPIEFKY